MVGCPCRTGSVAGAWLILRSGACRHAAAVLDIRTRIREDWIGTFGGCAGVLVDQVGTIDERVVIERGWCCASELGAVKSAVVALGL